MAPKAQKEPSWTGGDQQRALGPTSTQITSSLEAGSSFKRTQILVKLAPRFHDLDS